MTTLGTASLGSFSCAASLGFAYDEGRKCPSGHQLLGQLCQRARQAGYSLIIAGRSCPFTGDGCVYNLPVISVPIDLRLAYDSLYSIVQMPYGVPVNTTGH